MTRVLVTGGAGFIGSHTVERLLESGYGVRVLDSLEPQVHGNASGPPPYLSTEAEFMRGDVRDPQAVARAMSFTCTKSRVCPPSSKITGGCSLRRRLEKIAATPVYGLDSAWRGPHTLKYRSATVGMR